MPKKTFDSLSALQAGVRADLNKILKEQIAPQVQKVLLSHIQNDIYGVYNPTTYERRWRLYSGNNIVSDVSDCTLTVKDMTPGDKPIGSGYTPPGNVLIGIIQQGAQGNGRGKWKKAFARPAVKNAQQEINGGALVLGILRKNL